MEFTHDEIVTILGVLNTACWYMYQNGDNSNYERVKKIISKISKEMS